MMVRLAHLRRVLRNDWVCDSCVCVCMYVCSMRYVMLCCAYDTYACSAVLGGAGPSGGDVVAVRLLDAERADVLLAAARPLALLPRVRETPPLRGPLGSGNSGTLGGVFEVPCHAAGGVGNSVDVAGSKSERQHNRTSATHRRTHMSRKERLGQRRQWTRHNTQTTEDTTQHTNTRHNTNGERGACPYSLYIALRQLSSPAM